MIIKDEKNNILHFSSFLNCISSSVKVTNQFYNFNSVAGVAGNEKSSVLGSRTFSITGNFEANSSSDVERFRGEVFSSLFNKTLLLFLDDDTELYYKCVLDGKVNIAYNVGWNIARVFTLSFNLIAAIPFAYGEKKHCDLVEYTGIYFDIFYEGSVPSFCDIEFKFSKNYFLVADTKHLLSFNNRYFIRFKKNYSFKKDDVVFISKGLLYINRASVLGVLDETSILSPIVLTPDYNSIHLNKNQLNFSDLSTFTLTWQNLYY